VCHTYFHVYTALLLARHDWLVDKRRSLLILSFNRNTITPDFMARLNALDWADIVDVTDKSLVRRLDRMAPIKKFFLNLFVRIVYPRLNPKVKELPDTCGLRIFAFNDFHYICRYLFAIVPGAVTLIEDGNNNYTPIKDNWKKRLQKLAGVHPPFGRHPKVEKIMVQRPDDLPADVRGKSEFLNVPELLAALSSEERMALVHLFLGDASYELDRNAVLVLTQPYYDFGRTSHEQHLQVYSMIVEHFINLGMTVYLKPHPSDTVEYAAPGFEDARLLPKEFPIEILNQCSDCRIGLAVGINTTAVYNITFADKTASLLRYDSNIKDGYESNLRIIREGLNMLSEQT
jgi:hypothetical protein